MKFQDPGYCKYWTKIWQMEGITLSVSFSTSNKSTSNCIKQPEAGKPRGQIIGEIT